MRNYNEGDIARQIEDFPYWGRVAYAAACAQCLHPATERYSKLLADPALAVTTSGSLFALWNAIENQERVCLDYESIEALVPDDTVAWSGEIACAQNSVAAVVYAINSLSSGRTQEAVWAGRQVYELADFAVESQSASPVIIRDSLVTLASILDFIGSKPQSYAPLRAWCVNGGAKWVMDVISM